MDTLELCGDILQAGGQLETPGLVSKLESLISAFPEFPVLSST